MPRLLLIAALLSVGTGCIRDRFRREREAAALPDRAPPSATPVATPKPPQPPPLPSDPTPHPPSLPEVAPLAVSVPHTEVGTPPRAEPAGTPEVPATTGGDVAAVRALVASGRGRVETIPSLECRLTKREVVGGVQLPQDELVYRLRSRPKSVYMKVLSESGKGRELLYVEGQNSGKIAVLTGQGDNRLVGVGFRTNLAPDSRQATAKSRHQITQAGFERTLANLERAAATASAGRESGLKALGLVNRPESDYALEGVEVVIPPGVEPQLASGGKRRVFFDPKPGSPGFQLPVLIETFDAAGKEVEYYFFHAIAVPCPAPESAWDTEQLGR